jgi:hypothetical protein
MKTIATFILALTPAPVFAYLDPGTGSMLLSSVIALIATGVYTAKSIVFRLGAYMSIFSGKKIKQQNTYGLVFYNEGNQYFSTFQPLFKKLKELNMEFSYLYSEEDDYIVNEFPEIDSHYIGKGNKAFIYLNSLSASMCVMTTPGLDVLQIKRSRGVKHYCHLIHSAAGVAGYKVFSLDYFDSVLVQCDEDRLLVQRIEAKRKTNKKDVRIIGTPYLDFQVGNIRSLNVKKTARKTVLLSPTWGKNGLLRNYGIKILEMILSSSEYDVIVRPHPQTVEYEGGVIDKIKERFDNVSNLTWDLNYDGLQSMSESDCMISDFSGVILDYIYLFEKPVISIPSIMSHDGLDYVTKDERFWYVNLYYEITYILGEEELPQLDRIIAKEIKGQRTNDIESIKNRYCPYFGESSKQAAEEIRSIYNAVEMGGN